MNVKDNPCHTRGTISHLGERAIRAGKRQMDARRAKLLASAIRADNRPRG